MLVYIYTKADLIKSRLKYVLEFLEGHPNLGGKVSFRLEKSEEQHVQINYGIPEEADFQMPAQGALFKDDSIAADQLFSNIYDLDGSNIYSVETIKKDRQAFIVETLFSFDVFESIFFHISRYEEWFADRAIINKSGMVPEHLLLNQRAGIEQIPVVDWLVSAFGMVLGIPVKKEKTRYVLTHDIDKIYKYNNFLDAINAFGWPIVYKRNLVWGIRNIFGYIDVLLGRKKDPYDSYSSLFSFSKIWDKKIVFFMAGGRTRYDLYDRHYQEDFPEILKKALDAGYLPGIHPSFDTAGKQELLETELAQIEREAGRPIVHSRQHFLHYFPRKTGRILESSGIKLDATMGYTRKIGFRTGTGFEHSLYDFDQERPYSFQELPLVVMDSSLIHQSADQIEHAIQILSDFLQNNAKGTQICFNFHNSTFDSTLPSRSRLKEFYQRLTVLLESI